MSGVSRTPLPDLPKGPKAQIQQQQQQQQQQQPVKPASSSDEAKLISTVQLSRPFLTKNQVKHAQMKTITNTVVYDQRKNQTFQFLMRICQSLKFPTRVLETAMIYYQRYYLFNTFDNSSYYDIGITSLFIAIKNEDTIKKLRDIITSGNQIKNVQMSMENVENYKKKILRLEFKLLETISFDFRTYHTEEYLIKFSKKLKLPKEIAYLAWLITFDSFQTTVGLKVPCHSIALGTIYLACKIKKYDEFKIDDHLDEFHCEEASCFEAILDLLDIYINSYNYTGLVNFYPDLQNEFLEIKLPLNEKKGLRDTSDVLISKDQYFKEVRDFTNGERRYMLGNQKKRLYNEL